MWAHLRRYFWATQVVYSLVSNSCYFILPFQSMSETNVVLSTTFIWWHQLLLTLKIACCLRTILHFKIVHLLNISLKEKKKNKTWTPMKLLSAGRHHLSSCSIIMSPYFLLLSCHNSSGCRAAVSLQHKQTYVIFGGSCWKSVVCCSWKDNLLGSLHTQTRRHTRTHTHTHTMSFVATSIRGSCATALIIITGLVVCIAI